MLFRSASGHEHCLGKLSGLEKLGAVRGGNGRVNVLQSRSDTYNRGRRSAGIPDLLAWWPAQHFSLCAPYRPIAFSFHKSLLFLVIFFQDDTFAVVRNRLCISEITKIRVADTATLILFNLLIHIKLRGTPPLST